MTHKEYAGLVIEPDNCIKLIEFDSPYLELNDLYKHANCDTIQIIRTINPKWLMVIDDNGKLLRKPANPMATSLYYAYPYDFIVGTVFIGTNELPCIGDEPDVFAMKYDDAVALFNVLQESLKS